MAGFCVRNGKGNSSENELAFTTRKNKHARKTGVPRGDLIKNLVEGIQIVHLNSSEESQLRKGDSDDANFSGAFFKDFWGYTLLQGESLP